MAVDDLNDGAGTGAVVEDPLRVVQPVAQVPSGQNASSFGALHLSAIGVSPSAGQLVRGPGEQNGTDHHLENVLDDRVKCHRMSPFAFGAGGTCTMRLTLPQPTCRVGLPTELDSFGQVNVAPLRLMGTACAARYAPPWSDRPQ